MVSSARISDPDDDAERDGASVGFSDTAPLPFASLPPLDSNGYLPPGIHETTFHELEERFTGTPIRKIFWQRLLTFLRQVKKDGGFSNVYIGGGFIGPASSPADIDVVLQTRFPFGPEAFQAMEPLFAQGLDKIQRKHGIHLHFWCEGFTTDIQNFRDFFQNMKPDGPFPLECPGESKRGIVRVAL